VNTIGQSFRLPSRKLGISPRYTYGSRHMTALCDGWRSLYLYQQDKKWTSAYTSLVVFHFHLDLLIHDTVGAFWKHNTETQIHKYTNKFDLQFHISCITLCFCVFVFVCLLNGNGPLSKHTKFVSRKHKLWVMRFLCLCVCVRVFVFSERTQYIGKYKKRRWYMGSGGFEQYGYR
jgi:magnesium-transporting ATPase (P-type)